jgi:acetyl esterase/lipase
MNFLDQLDPELRVVLEAFPTEKAVDLNDIPAARAKMRKLFSTMQATVPPIEGVTSQDQSVPGPQGDPAVPVRIYQPHDRPSLLPALLWVHGGRATSWATSSKTTGS